MVGELTVEGPRVDPAENTFRGQQGVHGISKGEGEDEEQQRRNRKVLRLEIINLCEHSVVGAQDEDNCERGGEWYLRSEG